MRRGAPCAAKGKSRYSDASRTLRIPGSKIKYEGWEFDAPGGAVRAIQVVRRGAPCAAEVDEAQAQVGRLLPVGRV